MQHVGGTEGAVPAVRWPELLAAMSLACDTGMGLPLESGLATCLVAVEIGRAAGLTTSELGRTYRLAMLQHIGCTAVASENASIMGDELVLREHSALLDLSDNNEMFRFLLGHVARVNPVAARPMALFRAMAGGRRLMGTARDVCEAGRMLGSRCGYDADCLVDLERVYENWDGSGVPGGLARDEIPLPVQVVQVAALAVNADRLLDREAAAALVRSRSGHTLSPAVVEVFLRAPQQFLAGLDTATTLFDAVLEADPEPASVPALVDVEGALSAMADFADLNARFMAGHSRAVARLAGAAASAYGLPDSEAQKVRWAGYVHDVGRVSVSAATWNAAGPLRPQEREQIRMHPYYTQRVVERVPFLRQLSDIASCHHERLDGSGYYRGAKGPSLSASARILAAADAFQTKIEPRPHRAALDAEDAEAHLRAEAKAHRLDELAVEAVLTAAGTPRRGTHPKLTPREIEILVVAAHGGSMREVARELGISPKTVDGHLQRIYPKIGISTRAGATVYALEHGLLPAAVTGGDVGENSL